MRQIPPSSVEVVFNIDEGPEGQSGQSHLRRQPGDVRQASAGGDEEHEADRRSKSIVLENLFKKTFDVRKLEEDKERLRNAYQTKGYFRATVLKHDLETRDQKGRRLFPIPLLKKKKAKLADIHVTLDEGEHIAGASSASPMSSSSACPIRCSAPSSR